MTELHIPTMFVMILIATAIMAAALGVIAYRRHPDLQKWSLSLMLQVLAYALFSQRGHIHDVWSIVASNACITASVALYAAGLYRFHHQRYPWRQLVVPVTICIAAFWIFIDDYRARLAIGSALWMIQGFHLLALIVFFHRKTQGRGQCILGAAAAIFAGTQLYRLWAVQTGADHSAQFTDATLLVVLTYFSSLISTLLLAVGVLMMMQERDEHALRESESRYRKLIESATQGICVMQDLQFQFVNPKARELLGYKDADLLRQPVLSLIHPDDLVQVKANHALRIQGLGEGLTYVVRMQTGHRGWRWIEVSGVQFEWHGRPATLNFLTDVTERRESEHQIRDLAYHDALTHLPNRRLLLDHLKLCRAGHQRSAQHGALLFIDLDNFKPLNDLHGHAVGDMLLIEVAHRLLNNIRGVDTAARFGGDEFVVLLTQLSRQASEARAQAQQVAEKLLSVLEQPYVLTIDVNGAPKIVEHHCTGTAGVVIFNGDGEADDVLLDRADAAMYQAKLAGRNCVRFSENR